MLSLERPLGVVADLALFGDHAAANRVYYVPTKPRIASAGTAGEELSFVKFRSSDADAGGIGLLSFTTELVATAQQLEQAKQHVIRQGISEPVFAQVPWIGGKAVFATALAEGLAAYDRGDFFEAHELLEPAWMGTDDLAERDLLQGLIKLAAAYVHSVRGNPRGIATNLTGARERLAAARADGRHMAGLDLDTLIDDIDLRLAQLAKRPDRQPAGAPMLRRMSA